MIVVRDMLLFSWMFSLIKFQISTSFFLFRVLGTLRVLSELMTGFLLGVHVLTLWESDGHCSALSKTKRGTHRHGNQPDYKLEVSVSLSQSNNITVTTCNVLITTTITAPRPVYY